MKRSHLALVVMLLALAAQIFVFSLNESQEEPTHRSPDSESYLRMAQDLRGVAGAFDGREERRGERTPVYPAIMATLFELGLAEPGNLHGVVALQLVLSALTAGAAFLLASALSGARAGILAGLLVALAPSALAYAHLIMTETLYAFWLVALPLAWRWLYSKPSVERLLLLSLLAGLGPLIRPIAVYLPILLTAMICIRAPRMAIGRWAALLFLVLALLPSAGWPARNMNTVGAFTLSNSNSWGKALFARSVARAAGAETPRDSTNLPLDYWRQDYGTERGLSRAEINKHRGDYFRATLLAHPGTASLVWSRSLLYLVAVPDDLLATLLPGPEPVLVGGSVRARLTWLRELGALSALLVLGMASSVAGLASIAWVAWRARQWKKQEQSLAILIGLLTLYHLVLGALVEHQGARYRVPVVAFLAVFAATGISEWLAAWPFRRGDPTRSRG